MGKWVGLVGLLVVLISGGWVFAEPSEKPLPENCRLQFTVSRAGFPDAIYELSVAEPGRHRLNAMSRVPFRAWGTGANADAGEPAPVLSITYQNIGFLVDVKPMKSLGDGCFLVEGTFTDSMVEKREAPGISSEHPTVTEVSRSFSVKLCEGVSVDLARVSNGFAGETVVRVVMRKATP